jgi:hypothetical protein
MHILYQGKGQSQCQNSGVTVDVEDSTGHKMLIMATLNKYGN